jgi:hypothetical protein
MGMHLMWQLPADIGPVVAAWVTFELTEAPRVDELYFWALQATFEDAAGVDYGAAHTGLQWNPRHPKNGAVNWGGYPSEHSNWKKNLPGSEPTLPGFKDDPNTRNYPWQPHTPYRLSISAAPETTEKHPRGWRASVRNLITGDHTVLRDLWAEGDRLTDLCTWTEWFCGCDDPTVAVTWTGFRVMTEDGTEHEPTGMFLNHPSDGNCTNVGHRIITQQPELVIEQRMNTVRELPHGTVVPIRLAPPAVTTEI